MTITSPSSACIERSIKRIMCAAATLLLVGCSTIKAPDDHGRLDAASDQYLHSADLQLNLARDRISGGDLREKGALADRSFYQRDRVLNGSEPARSTHRDVVLSGPDHTFQAQNLSPLKDTPETPKRRPDAREMLAITMAASESVGDPNAIEIVQAGLDDTNAAVRVVCARLRDYRLDEENNRFNVFFGVVAQESKELRVSVIDSGPRATVACEQLGYIQARTPASN